MRRLVLLTLVTLLALPGAALARTFPARVVNSSAQAVTVRLPGGKVVRYVHPRIAGAAGTRSLMAHAARAVGPQITFNLGALDPGVAVLVTQAADGVSIALPGPGAPEQRAIGVVSEVRSGTFVLRLNDHTNLRLHGHGVHACEAASVAYHQDVVLLVADSVHAVRGHAAHCTSRGGHAASGHVQRMARGTVTAAAAGTVTIIDAVTGRQETFATNATPVVGDHVVIVYHRSGGGAVADALYGLAA
jgi:hypothetical protein